MNQKKVLDFASKLEKKDRKNTGGSLDSPCTLAEALQIANAVVADYMTTYQQQKAPLELSLAIQVDVLKFLLIKNGILDEKEFVNLCNKKMAEIRDMNEKPTEEPELKMEVRAGEVEVKKLQEE